ncbi:MAG: DNA cytosine methyltransferase [Acidimicrobiia bacterium]
MSSVHLGTRTATSHAGHVGGEQLVLRLGDLADDDPGRVAPREGGGYCYTVVIRRREETGLGARPIAISLFAGAGGLDLGVEAAGYQVAAANEIDDDAADTLEKNFVDSLMSPVDRRSIVEVPTRDLMRAAGLKGNERPELLVGGPPCTPFSKSGFWLDWKREGLDPSASLLQMYTRVLREARPRAFILENVYALTFNNKASRPAYDRLLHEIDEAGYAFTAGVLNAADYGIPQLRPRLFVVGVPKGKPLPRLPEPTHTGAWERRRTGASANGAPHITAGEAIEGIVSDPEPEEVLRGQYAALLPDIPPGDNYLFYTAKRGHRDPQFEWRSRYWSFLLKLAPNRPSPTIQAQPGPNVGPFHWENRRLRVPELKRLFTYPDDFAFVGSRSSVQAQIGNSVPPLLAKQVAEAVLASTHA